MSELNMTHPTPEESEELRKALLADEAASKLQYEPHDYMGDGLEDIRPMGVAGSFGYHEALHVTSVIEAMFSDHVLEHPALLLDKDAFALGHKAQYALNDLYQYLGAKHLIDDK